MHPDEKGFLRTLALQQPCPGARRNLEEGVAPRQDRAQEAPRGRQLCAVVVVVPGQRIHFCEGARSITSASVGCPKSASSPKDEPGPPMFVQIWSKIRTARAPLGPRRQQHTAPPRGALQGRPQTHSTRAWPLLRFRQAHHSRSCQARSRPWHHRGEVVGNFDLGAIRVGCLSGASSRERFLRANRGGDHRLGRRRPGSVERQEPVVSVCRNRDLGCEALYRIVVGNVVRKSGS